MTGPDQGHRVRGQPRAQMRPDPEMHYRAGGYLQAQFRQRMRPRRHPIQYVLGLEIRSQMQNQIRIVRIHDLLWLTDAFREVAPGTVATGGESHRRGGGGADRM